MEWTTCFFWSFRKESDKRPKYAVESGKHKLEYTFRFGLPQHVRKNVSTNLINHYDLLKILFNATELIRVGSFSQASFLWYCATVSRSIFSIWNKSGGGDNNQMTTKWKKIVDRKWSANWPILDICYINFRNRLKKWGMKKEGEK